MIFNRFKRTNFISQHTNDNDNIEYDLILNNWDLFDIRDNITFDTVQYGDIQRPDILSYRIYGSSEYWWILCKFNQIDDIWNDMYIGQELIIPNINDIIRFYNNVRKRVAINGN